MQPNQNVPPRVVRAAGRGFTLIEILIVLAIVLLLAGLVSVSLFGRRDQADIQITQVNLNTLSDALDQFRLDYRRYPTEEEGLEVLWSKETLDPDADQAVWSKYLSEPMTADQWGNPYGYSTEDDEYSLASDPMDTEGDTGPSYRLWSNGPDGEEGTEDDITLGGTSGDSDSDAAYEDFLPAGDP
ncbi:MAG: type II secretion system major pseudopilin GspG [Phycisphaerales bacterium JB040]